MVKFSVNARPAYNKKAEERKFGVRLDNYGITLTKHAKLRATMSKNEHEAWLIVTRWDNPDRVM